MSVWKELSLARRAVLLAAFLLLVVWVGLHIRMLVWEQNGFIRFGLGTFFAALILFRSKRECSLFRLPSWVIPATALIGTFLAVGGIVFYVHQFEWLGLMLLFFACLAWALPESCLTDIVLSLFLFYWIHPLPTQVFAPLQFTMQKMSVNGAEWLLHVLNVRVWADQFVLKTGVNVYEIPAECSGMKTATTVFLLGLGLGLSKRFKWRETAVLIIAALVQALALNVLRISVMVLGSPSLAQDAGKKFLHDTTGIIVVMAAFLLVVELFWWERRKQHRAALGHDVMEQHKKAYSEHPPFWRYVRHHKWRILMIVAAIGLTAFVAFKSRPYHRAEMLKDVALALSESHKADEAQQVADIVMKMEPYDADWQLMRIRLMVIRRKYEEALAELKKTDAPATDKAILQAYSLMGLKRMDEAATIIQALPESVRRSDARVAMIMAELAVRANDPDEVARSIVVARKWAPNMARIRALYPYLRIHRKWEAIAKSDMNVPYTDVVQALSATEANMNADQVPRIGNLAMQAMESWPDDPRVLEPLFFMTLQREGTDWEDRFAVQLVRSVKKIQNPDALYLMFGKCFQIGRPDLSWFIYRRIHSLDPSYPGLPMCVALYGDDWFSFRRQYLGFNAPRAADRVDLRYLFLVGRLLDSWQELCNDVPEGMQLCVTDTIAVRKQYLQQALAQFKKHDESGSGGMGGLSVRMWYEYVLALEMTGDFAGAKRQVERLVSRNPDEKEKAQFVLSEIYERNSNWPEVYETLHGYSAEQEPNLMPLIRLGRSELQLHLGLAAIDTARTAIRLFPNSPQAAALLGDALITYDSPEEALLALEPAKTTEELDLGVLEAKSLYLTERFSEIAPFCRAVQLPVPYIDPDDTMQRMYLPPAEASAMWHFLAIPSGRAFRDTARILAVNRTSATGPFLKGLIELWLDCYDNQCGAPSADPGKWVACGRDNTEKAILLNQLTVLLCWQEKFAEARNVAGMAVKFMPQCPTLWRIFISLSGRDPEVAAAACKACPTDSEIWLANLVITTQRGRSSTNTENWALAEVAKAAAANTFTPAAMTRAGDYLLRGGMINAATLAASNAVSRARGLLPAHMLGMQCAMSVRDRELALASARGGIKSSLRRMPLFYKKLVELKGDKPLLESDNEMVEALRNLRIEYPNDPLWARMLGYIRYKRGGWETVDALEQLQMALDAGATNKSTYIVAAEAARMIGNAERAVDILRNGLQHYPDDIMIINNLAYTLCMTPDGANEAIKLAPRIEEVCADNLAFMDTLALVYVRAGDFEKGSQMASKILTKVKADTPEWFRARLRLAEIAVRSGKTTDAVNTLKDILSRTHGVSEEDIFAARDLLTKAKPAASQGSKEKKE
jgi:exosortase